MNKLLLIFFLLNVMNPDADIDMEENEIIMTRGNQTVIIELVQNEDGSEKFLIKRSITTKISDDPPVIEKYHETPE